MKMKLCAISVAVVSGCLLSSCVSSTVTSPDGTVTRSNSFAPSVEQLQAGTALAEAVRGGGK